jgi:hypothetical protein
MPILLQFGGPQVRQVVGVCGCGPVAAEPGNLPAVVGY